MLVAEALVQKSRSTRETLAEVIEFINKISEKRVITQGNKQTAYFKVLALPEDERQEALEVYRQKILKSSEGSVAGSEPEYTPEEVPIPLGQQTVVLPGQKQGSYVAMGTTPQRPSSKTKPKLTRKKKWKRLSRSIFMPAQYCIMMNTADVSIIQNII